MPLQRTAFPARHKQAGAAVRPGQQPGLLAKLYLPGAVGATSLCR